MGLHVLLGLLLFALATRIDTTAPLARSTVLVSDFSNWVNGVRTASDPGIDTKRFLRDVVDGDNDERGGGNLLQSVPKLEKLKAATTSSNISPGKLKEWLNKGKSADSAFVGMGLIPVKEGLFHSPRLSKWLSYGDALNARTPGKGTPAISTLTKHYGDAKLFGMIKVAKQSSDAEIKALATRLQSEQLQHWLAAATKPDEVFHIMKLNVLPYKYLEDAELATWVKYVDDFNAANPTHPASMAASLTNYINGGRLFKEAEAAKRVSKSEGVAIKIQEDLKAFWLNSGKTPDDLLNELGFGYAVFYKRSRNKTLLEKPRFQTWAKYLDDFNAKYPDQKTTMIEALTRKFVDSDVAWMIQVAKTEASTRSLATKLETAQLEMWWSSKKSAEDVLKLLWPYYAPGFTTTPLMQTWVSYMGMYLRKNPSETASLLSMVKNYFANEPLDRVIQAAKKFPSMEAWAKTT